MFYELDSNGYFICDSPSGSEGLAHWTTTPMPQPIGIPRFIDGAWVDEALPDVIPVPEEVTMRQARLALLQAGLLDQVESALTQMTGVEGQAAKIEWEYSQSVRRDKPFVLSIGGLLGLTSAQLDDLFVAAAVIS
jgi:hypothetical protein